MFFISKHKHKFLVLFLFTVSLLFFTSCSTKPSTGNEALNESKVQIVATTTMLADLARTVGGDFVEVHGLMGPGVDPHLYKATPRDVTLMQEADLILYNGLHLEGKLSEIFENLESMDKQIVVISEGLTDDDLIIEASTKAPDPHIWFDVRLWKESSRNLLKGLTQIDPTNKEAYSRNFQLYESELDALDAYIKEQISNLPPNARVLITAHDAFQYFGKAYEMEVLGLLGISTVSEAGTGDVKKLADYIVEKQIKAIFVESSVPKKSIIALQEAVRSQGFTVEIGGELYSDSLGSTGTEAETYIGTVKSNIDTIVTALK